ncbi:MULTISPECIES: DUF4149 domain-containing protein [unclassified Helicobacter]|uniref:DUF4149 domain-containing protein n=1 Tax=unclassified Helicobacter TaxID=2593540 RepID=UPI001F3836D6|nr:MULTISPECIES: DUF4149 domain-containing protein [unclassified Helicobacter]
MNKEAFKLFLQTAYLWILGISMGSIIACGMFVAPVIFNAYSFLPDLGITQYDSGILMTQVFLKLNTLLNFTAIIILVYELLAFNLSKRTSFFPLGINIINVILIFLFSFYFTPKIIEAQKQGAAATATPEFATIHIQSEYTFKILLVMLTIGFFARVFLLAKSPVAKAKK